MNIAKAIGRWLNPAEDQSIIEQKSATLAYPDASLFEIFGSVPVASGVSVNARTAMSCPAVRCAVQAISEAIGQLPILVYSRGADGSKERAPEHPVYKLIHDQATDWMSASDFREQLQRDALLHGNGLAFINRVGGKPVELLRLDPPTVNIEQDQTTGEPLYSQGRQHFDRQDILHIKAPSFDGVKGIAPIHQCREAIGLSIILEKQAATLFGRGGRPDGVLTSDKVVGAIGQANLLASWRKQNSEGRSGGTTLLEDGVKFEPISFTSTDSQFLENRSFQVLEISRAFRVPPIFLQDYSRGTWSNSEEQGRQLLTFCLLPWIKRWEGEIALKLFQGDSEHYAEFLTDDLLRGDIDKRMDAYGKAIAARILSPNEARAAENRAPYAGGDTFENPNTSTAATSSLTQEKPQ